MNTKTKLTNIHRATTSCLRLEGYESKFRSMVARLLSIVNLSMHSLAVEGLRDGVEAKSCQSKFFLPKTENPQIRLPMYRRANTQQYLSRWLTKQCDIMFLLLICQYWFLSETWALQYKSGKIQRMWHEL